MDGLIDILQPYINRFAMILAGTGTIIFGLGWAADDIHTKVRGMQTIAAAGLLTTLKLVATSQNAGVQIGNYIGIIGGLIAGLGGVMFGLGWAENDDSRKTTGLRVIVIGGVMSVCSGVIFI